MKAIDRLGGDEAAGTFLDDLRERVAASAGALEAAPALARAVEALAEVLPDALDGLDVPAVAERLGAVEGAAEALHAAGPDRPLGDDALIRATAIVLVGKDLLLTFPEAAAAPRP